MTTQQSSVLIFKAMETTVKYIEKSSVYKLNGPLPVLFERNCSDPVIVHLNHCFQSKKFQKIKAHRLTFIRSDVSTLCIKWILSANASLYLKL